MLDMQDLQTLVLFVIQPNLNASRKTQIFIPAVFGATATLKIKVSGHFKSNIGSVVKGNKLKTSLKSGFNRPHLPLRSTIPIKDKMIFKVIFTTKLKQQKFHQWSKITSTWFTSAALQNEVEATEVTPHGGAEPRGPRRLPAQTAWGCSSLLTKTQADQKITNNSGRSQRWFLQQEHTVSPCRVLHTSPRRSPPWSPSPPRRPGSCLGAGHKPAGHQQPQRRQASVEPPEGFQKHQRPLIPSSTYVQPATEFTVVPHLHVDPLVQAESDQV